jgi:protein-S-isoprenylcysteine O-methyltransferase Ste14
MPRKTQPHVDGPDRAEVAVRPPLLWLALVAAGYGLDRLLPLPFLPAGFPALWTGLAIWLAGLLLAGTAIAQFRRAGTDVSTHTGTDTIVDTGLFAWSRNPIYVGAHIGIIGAAIALDSGWVLVALIPFHVIIRYGVVAREEAYLERKFGNAYVAYKARVRRWL